MKIRHFSCAHLPGVLCDLFIKKAESLNPALSSELGIPIPPARNSSQTVLTLKENSAKLSQIKD
jgi:hypothetical protein